MDHQSQNKQIEDWLRAGNSITPLEALERFGCFRLSGRIFDIRAAGVPIVTETVTKNGKRFASYRLEKSNAT